MSLFRKLFGQKEKKQEAALKTDPEVFRESLLEIVRIISRKDSSMADAAEQILKDPDGYISDTYGANRPIDFAFTFKEDIQDKQWWLIHDALTQKDHIHYLDWKDDAGAFLAEFDSLKGRDSIPAVIREQDLTAEEELTAIFSRVNDILEPHDAVLGVYEIEADGYPIFLTKKSRLKELSELAQRLGHRIGRAESF